VARVADVLAELGSLFETGKPEELDQAEVVACDDAFLVEVGVRRVHVRLVCILFPDSGHLAAKHAGEGVPLYLLDALRVCVLLAV